jgi:hypothetical protein
LELFNAFDKRNEASRSETDIMSGVMSPIGEYKFVGLLAVAILAFGLTFLVVKWPLGIHRTFSQHAAVKRMLTTYYFALFSVALSLLLTFFITWFVPTFQVSRWFILLVAASSVCQILCTLIPETKGWKVRWHQILAGLSAILLLPSLFVLFYANTVQIDGKICLVISIFMMCGVIATTLIRRTRLRHQLLLQATYFIAYFVPIMYISYLM